MQNLEKGLVGVVVALILSLGFNVGLAIKLGKKQNEFVAGANSQFGMPCIYTTSARTLTNGNGTAFTCDSAGRLILTN